MPGYLVTGADMLKARPNFKLVGRANALQRLCSIIIKNKNNSIVVTGAGGVGISSLTLGLQAYKNESGVPFDILCKRIFWLDTDALFDSGDNKLINSSFKDMMRILNTTPESVLVVEDTFGFIEASRNAGCTHFINAFMSSIKAKTNQFIFETRDDTLDGVLKCHSDMLEKTTLFNLNEPKNGDLLDIARETAKSLSEWHNIKIDESAILEAVELTNTHRVRDASLSKAQPERTINLLDAALSSLRLSAHKVDPDTEEQLKTFHQLQRDSEKTLMALDEELVAQVALEQHQNPKETSTIDAFSSLTNATMKSKEVRLIEKVIAEETAAYKVHTQNFKELTAKINSGLVLNKAVVQTEFSNISGIPIDKLNEDSRTQLRNLVNDLNARIFDQSAAVNKIADFIKTTKMDRKNKLPVRVLLLGPSGVGKTETARAISDYLQVPLIRFNMADYSEKHAVAKLINCPPGYEGFVAGGGILIQEGRNNPTAVFLFDEIEKADAKIFDTFLAMMDDGFVNDNLGRPVSFANAIVVMTTNVGQKHFLLEDEIGWDLAVKMANEDLMKSPEEGGGGYRNEFLNRFYGKQGILCYHRLGLPAMKKIALREFNNLAANYKDDNIKIVINSESIDAFVQDRYDPATGARGLPGIIASEVRPVIVDQMLADNFTGGTLNITYDTKFHTTFTKG